MALPLRPPAAAPRRLRTVLAAAILAALPLGLGASPAAADIFTYTDENGVVHFSNKSGDPRFKLYVKSSKARRSNAFKGAAVMPSDKSPERFSRYDTWIRQAAILYQLPEELVRAVMKVESDFDPRATSSAGAQGLMQLMPETAARMQVRDAYDARENIFGGTRYLRILANMFNGDLDLTIAGYNAGEGAVAKYGGIPPYAETQDYVVRVRTYYAAYRSTRDVLAASTVDVPHRPELVPASQPSTPSP